MLSILGPTPAGTIAGATPGPTPLDVVIPAATPFSAGATAHWPTPVGPTPAGTTAGATPAPTPLDVVIPAPTPLSSLRPFV
jgi:hypothetical protein